MRTEKQDRRIRKTKKLLRDSLVETLQSKELTKITVRELCQHADINRSTFYLHYRDIFDLWRQLENKVEQDLKEILSSFSPNSIITNPLPLLLEISKLLEEEKEFNKLLFSSRESIIFLDQLKEDFIKYFMDENQDLIKKSKDRDFEFYITFAISGIFSLFTKWFVEEKDFPLEKLAHTIEQLIFQGVGDFLKNSQS
ncbi:MAG: TetR family transcriptional regulator C-terminal domain-containing protein [Spirochaetaceae bacterium]